jgi:hypothetical protein
MRKQQAIQMLNEKERKYWDVLADGMKSSIVLTPMELNLIKMALCQPDVEKLRRQQELLRELTQIVSEQA